MGWVVSFTRRPPYPQGKNSWYPLDRRLGGPQSRYGRGGEEKNSYLYMKNAKKIFLCLNTMTYEEVDVEFHAFLLQL
jgi:hypothetical protein